jgi:hypothetical protein
MFATTVKTKSILTVLSVLLLGAALYEIPSAQNTIGVSDDVGTPTHGTSDPFAKDIQTRSDLVYNAVSEAVNQQGMQQPITYKQTCEKSVSFIHNERLDTDYQFNMRSEEQKELTRAYWNYLDEAAYIVSVCYSGETPDLTKMNKLKKELY